MVRNLFGSFLIAVAITCLISFAAQAGGPQDRFARRLNRHPVLHHAVFGRGGAEVVYRQSHGRATPEAAYASWQNSPGHASLINQGKISNVVCHGRVCVGR